MKIKIVSTLILISSLIVTTSCSSIQEHYHPSWVTQLASGEGSTKVNMQGQIFYRSLITNLDPSISSCDQAVIKASEYLKNEYSDLPTIPYTVEVVYEFDQGKKCAATISVKNKNLEIASKLSNELSTLNKSKEEFESKTKIELEEIEVKKIAIAEENKKLAEKKQQLLDIVRQNQIAIKETNNLSEFVSYTLSGLRNVEKTILRYLHYGIKFKEFKKIIKDNSIQVISDYSSPCKGTKNPTTKISIHGKLHVCWIEIGFSIYSNDENYMTSGWCDTESMQCWSRDYRLTQNK